MPVRQQVVVYVMSQQKPGDLINSVLFRIKLMNYKLLVANLQSSFVSQKYV